MDPLPQVQEKDPKPPGLLPKRVESWLLVGIAVVMVGIMWLTGGKKTPSAPKSRALLPTEAPAEVTDAKIVDLQRRIEELQRQQLAAQNALADQTRLLGRSAEDSAPAAQGASAPERQEDPIEAERRRRAYLALFASNVALSYRPTTQASPAAEPLAQGPQDAPLPIAAPVPAGHSTVGSAEAKAGRKEETHEPAAVSGGAADAAAGKTYILFEGTILDAVLINRLDGDFAGPVECLVSTNVYSRDRQHLLIPAGSKILGETRKVDAFGQTRLAVVFHRLIMPDGYSVSLDQFKGLDETGDTGLRDQVNNHYLRIFGVSLAIGALGAVAEGGTAASFNTTSSDLMRQGFATSTAQSSAQILDKFLNILPTVTIREGHGVEVYLSGDLALPDYLNHQMPSDL